MWECFGISITDLEDRPTRGERLAAAFRQLERAHTNNDVLAAWQATASFAISFRRLLEELLSQEASWDTKGRWIDGLAGNKVFYRRPRKLRVIDEMIWGLKASVGGKQWAEPLRADFELTPDLLDLTSYTIRLGKSNILAGDVLQSGSPPDNVEAEESISEWRYVWSKGTF